MTPYDIIYEQMSDASSLDDLTNVLFILLNGDFAVWDDGALYSIRQLVANVNGLKVEIYAKEHAPPHFHVKGGDLDVVFSIQECELLEGKVEGRRLRLIQWWHEKSKDKLIDIWNKTRPCDCPVGAM